jgi:hypothetical protein
VILFSHFNYLSRALEYIYGVSCNQIVYIVGFTGKSDECYFYLLIKGVGKVLLCLGKHTLGFGLD